MVHSSQENTAVQRAKLALVEQVRQLYAISILIDPWSWNDLIIDLTLC
ncbi:MAG: hypothetical protein O4861_21105 [Trichodesmium sp. St16_bin4-tuft]|nr:hypothetical protein [Trichodesmium sp. St5_bin8]MDE5076964.1 hypothetical protein [Trichodesmium sp. St2_bin6]MDE5100693.1 hypothetical protein [Trichodesmium sp. St16_bin4-tuft]